MDPPKGKNLLVPTSSDLNPSPSPSSPPPPPDLNSISPVHSHSSLSPIDDMALVAHNNPTSLLGTGLASAPNAGINKRYRPAPAKTFQCRGYGECRMVFSRSEHLARHIRKHTGERPFTCHCGKQFSRLDNLRQHAQTVHADKADQNEQMMRDLTSLHANMAAATKSTPRNKRGQASNPISNNNGDHAVKQEDNIGDSFRGRPGTSTGYEGDHNGIYQGYESHLRPDNRHSFRDHSQSFLAPSSSSSTHSQSFLAFSNTFNFVSGDGSTTSRPHTGGGNAGPLARTLPPLAAVVSRALPSSSSFPIAPTSTQHILPVPGSLAFRRPSTATRPGTAPASSYYATKSTYAGGNGVAAVSLPGYTGRVAAGYDGGEPPTSPTGPGGTYESPFSFHPPSIADAAPGASSSSSSSTIPNPRKRPYPGSDGDDTPSAAPRCREQQQQQQQQQQQPAEYDYGSESRPQSRRLSVMELCNDTDADAGSRPVLSGVGGGGGSSRPTTSSGITASTSALALVDRASRLLSSELFGGTTSSTAGADARTTSIYGASSQASGGGGSGVYTESRRDFSSSSATAAAAASSALYPTFRGQYPTSPVSDASSPRSSSSSVTATAAPSSPFATRAAGRLSSSPDTPGSLSVRRGGESHVSSPQSPAPVGMRA